MSILRNHYIRTFLKLVAANAFPQELFNQKTEIQHIKELFKSYVKHFEIEPHSYCNRTCWFCPNSSVDRISTNTSFNKSLLLKILRELADINYDQSFIWAGYCEPLAEETIFEYIRLTKDMLPHAYQRLYSNGDYLTEKIIRRLETAGLDQLRVSLYPLSDYDLEKPKLLKSLENRTGLRIVQKTKQYNGLQLIGSSILIIVQVKEFKPKNMYSRGGYLLNESGYGNYVRTMPCISPIVHLSVAYNGKCMLCCQVRPDVKEHESAIIGDLNNDNYSVFHYYRDLASSREALLRPGIKKGVCLTCSFNPFGGGPYKLGRIDLISKVLNNVPGVKFLMNSLWLYPRMDRERYKVSGDP